MNDEEDGKALVGHWVLHTLTGTVGKVKDFRLAGETGVNAPVVELEAGHTFVYAADRFQRITEKERDLYLVSERLYAEVTGEIAKSARAQRLDPRTVAQLLAHALRAQATAIAGAPPAA